MFEQDRAIMLGAQVSRRDRKRSTNASAARVYDLFTNSLSSLHQPPKREYVNYKTLQQQIKEKKQKEKEDVQPVRAPVNQIWRDGGVSRNFF